MVFGIDYLPRLFALATGYKAKLLCSGVFVSRREPESILEEDLAADSLWLLRYFRASVDREQQTVTASLLGQFQRTAVYRPGLGSTLAIDSTVEQLRQQSESHAVLDSALDSRSSVEAHDLPIATTPLPEIDGAQLEQIVEDAFVESNPKKLKRTRAVLVLYKGEVIAERYAPDFSAATPLLGWSMTKSVISTLLGILVGQGKLSLEQDDLLAQWRSLPEDPRRKITLDQLLHMSSGLQFGETYTDPRSDVNRMLFQQNDAATYVAGLPLAESPDSQFVYASGTTVLLSQVLREVIGGTLADYWAFPRRALFDRLGMTSAVIEPDATGTFVGSSFMYATARDWAKLGLLYLQDGVWQGQRILPPGWVDYSIRPSRTSPRYGAHWWRQVPLSFTANGEPCGTWPEDAYLASGYQGQFVTMIPSRELVVVRLGLSQASNAWDHEAFINQVLLAVPRVV